MDQPTVLLFGAGGIGTIYLYLFSKVASVTAVCRSNYEVVHKEGFLINSSIFGQNIRFRPHVVRTCDDMKDSGKGCVDFLLIASKAMPGTVPELIRPAVTPDRTVIVLLQNGIGIEEEYAAAFPENPILSCVIYLPATQRPAGVIKHGEVERLEIGTYPATANSDHASRFVDLIRSAGGTVELHDDVQYRRWYKLVINAAWNPLCAITRSTDVQFMQSSTSATNLVLEVMLEIAAIARAYGHEISHSQVDDQLDKAIARIKNDSGIEPSMLQDVLAKRRIEVEAIVGNTVRLGKEKGVHCEKLEMVYILAKALDEQIRRDGLQS